MGPSCRIPPATRKRPGFCYDCKKETLVSRSRAVWYTLQTLLLKELAMVSGNAYTTILVSDAKKLWKKITRDD
jgi:hypothetical protein